MKVKYGGKYIVLEDADDWDSFFTRPELVCTCGHHISEHEYHFLPGDRRTIEVTFCKRSGHCDQFKRRGRETLNFSYA
jgi:hypothetical protein